MGSSTNKDNSGNAAPEAKVPGFYKRLQMLAAKSVGLGLIHVIFKTTWFKARGIEFLEKARGDPKAPCIFALFHGPHFPVLYYWRHRALCVVTSRSSDGQILTNILHSMGFETVRGSSSRGGMRATIELARRIQQGQDIAVAVDGPRGPAMEVKPGIVLLGKITGRPIIPITACAKSFWRFQSWDQFRLPLPFNKALIVASEPILVPEDADDQQIEQIRADLEITMNQVQQQIDTEMKPWILRLPNRAPKKKTQRKNQQTDTPISQKSHTQMQNDK
jgi:lysophospholipid acyltransferase (LPLAT)-like uncharacterized protein